MRIKAESKVITLGDLRKAVAEFEAQGFQDSDVLNPPSKYLPPESKETRDTARKMGLAAFARAVEDSGIPLKTAGVVLFMVRETSSGDGQ